MDACSKRVLLMRHSNTLDRRFCVKAVEEAVRKHGYPEIIHSDKEKPFLKQGLYEIIQRWKRRKDIQTEF